MRHNDIHIWVCVHNDIHVWACLHDDIHIWTCVHNDIHIWACLHNDIHIWACLYNAVSLYHSEDEVQLNPQVTLDQESPDESSYHIPTNLKPTPESDTSSEEEENPVM